MTLYLINAFVKSGARFWWYLMNMTVAEPRTRSAFVCLAALITPKEEDRAETLQQNKSGERRQSAAVR